MQNTLLFSHHFDLEIVTYKQKLWINHWFNSFVVHPEQLPPRPWITLKERDQILPSGKSVVFLTVFTRWHSGKLVLGFIFLDQRENSNLVICTRKINTWLCCKYHFYHLHGMLGISFSWRAWPQLFLPLLSNLQRLTTFPFLSLLAASFTVMCYNVLCDKYATRQLYGYCPSWALNWEYRKKGIMEEIVNCDADIISLQVIKNNCIFPQKHKTWTFTFRIKCSLWNTVVTCSRANSRSSPCKLCIHIPVSDIPGVVCCYSKYTCHFAFGRDGRKSRNAHQFPAGRYSRKWHWLCSLSDTARQGRHEEGFLPITSSAWGVCVQFQEVETEQYFTLFLPALKERGYDGFFSPKSRAKIMSEQEKKHVDGCAIFFKTEK